MTCALAIDPVDELLDRAKPALIRWAPAAIRVGAGSALILTVDLDGDPMIDLWPLARIAGMLGARAAVARKIERAHATRREDGSFLVVVCARGARPTAITMRINGWSR